MRLCAEPAFGVSGAHRQVVAPSITPHRPGGRIKTNQRGCLKLARWVRAGELTAVAAPQVRDEATSVFPAQAGIHCPSNTLCAMVSGLASPSAVAKQLAGVTALRHSGLVPFLQ